MIKIGNKEVGHYRTFIIAELSCNHRGSLDIALQTVEEVAKAGVNAIKVQTMMPETMSLDLNHPNFTISGGTIWDGRTFFDLYKEAYLPLEWHMSIKKKVEDLGLIFFSTPFGRGFADIPDPTDFLEDLGVPCYKIASFEITDVPFIKHVASKQKPIIISTGVATFDDIKLAVDACKSVGNNNIILLKCTSAYPTPMSDVNLLTMTQIAKDFGTLVGISDHSMDNEVAIASVALGGCVIEKHVILDRKLGGPDADFSLEPHEFKVLVESIRKTEQLLGVANYDLTQKQQNSRKFCRSIFVCQDINQGEMATIQNIRSLRPGHGLNPKLLPQLIGKKAVKGLKKGDIPSLEDFR